MIKRVDTGTAGKGHVSTVEVRNNGISGMRSDSPGYPACAVNSVHLVAAGNYSPIGTGLVCILSAVYFDSLKGKTRGNYGALLIKAVA